MCGNNTQYRLNGLADHLICWLTFMQYLPRVGEKQAFIAHIPPSNCNLASAGRGTKDSLNNEKSLLRTENTFPSLLSVFLSHLSVNRQWIIGLLHSLFALSDTEKIIQNI